MEYQWRGRSGLALNSDKSGITGKGRATARVGSRIGAPGGWTCPVIAAAENLAMRLPTVPDAPGPPAGKCPACGGYACRVPE